MPRYRAVGAVVLGLTLAASCVGVSAAQADSVVAPQVYVRLLSPYNDQPWVPLSATINDMGPYELGVKVQPEPDTEGNRQAVQVDLTSSMGSIPEQPFASTCQNIVGTPGSIWGLGGGGILYYTGNGAYGMKVSAYTDAQHNTFPGNTCSGGPTTSVTMTVNLSATARIAGTPIVPRITRRARGFVGLAVTEPPGALGAQWRCARDPVFGAGGSLTGTVVTGQRVTSRADVALLRPAASATTLKIAERDAFKEPGRWACEGRALGGNDVYPKDFGATPWARTPVITVKGEYERSNSRLSFAAHGRMHLTVSTPRFLRPFAAGGRLTLAIQRASCASARKGIARLHTLFKVHARLNAGGRATFSFRPPTRQVFYRGYLTFGGSSLLLPGADAPMFLQVSQPPNPHARPKLHFVPPTAWDPCA